MTKMILSIFIIFLSMLMMFLNNPLSMGLMILIQTTLMCVLSSMLIKTYWFSYILFLIFLGGLLVLFIYVSSIASNELFKPSFNMKITFFYFMLMLIIIISIYSKSNNLIWMNLSNNSDMNNLFTLNDLFINNNMYKINLNNLYNTHTFMIMLLLLIYLLITLIVVVKITNIFYGPLRSNF